jgi:dihydroorotate dehydrogenase electron transfer subunit
MACGYGVCMTCVMPLQRPGKRNEEPADAIVYARTCTEGPVFNGAAVVWNGAASAVADDQAELSPAGVPMRPSAIPEPVDEHAPPGN